MGRNLKAYVDDMVIKSKTELDMIKDIEETLLTLKKVNIKLNPKKCSFGMEEGKFLRYIITSEGIRANSEKTKVVMNMPSLSSLKQMQLLSGKLAALNRFVSKAAERAMKKLIVELPTLTAPMKGEELMIYLSAANEAVSVVLLVITDKPIIHILNNREATGRLAKWAIELEAYGIKYASRKMIKGQVLADFRADTMVEDSPAHARAAGQDGVSMEGKVSEVRRTAVDQIPIVPLNEMNIWKLYTDGASNNHGSGVDAEYEALLAGLMIAAKMKVKKMHAFVDSKLVVIQVEGSYEARGEKTKKYRENVLEMV
ncbi:reverse transcriptase domain-containing protein [Tanacetum coccineum]